MKTIQNPSNYSLKLHLFNAQKIGNYKNQDQQKRRPSLNATHTKSYLCNFTGKFIILPQMFRICLQNQFDFNHSRLNSPLIRLTKDNNK
jgi:hypothetical protein